MSTVNGFQVGSEILKYNYESLENYNTPNFSTSSSTTYTIGDYVMYNGKLYKCTTATTGGTWVSGSWTEAVLSDDVSDLNRQLSDVDENQIPEIKNAIDQLANTGKTHVVNWVNGSWGGSSTASPYLTDDNTRIRPSAFIPVKVGDVVTISNGTSYQHAVAIWSGSQDNASKLRSDSSWIAAEESIGILYDGFMIVAFADGTDTSTVLDPADFDGDVSVSNYSGKTNLVLSSMIETSPNYKWVSGLIKPSTGSYSSDDSYIMTDLLYGASTGAIKITAKAGYRFCFAVYNLDGSFRFSKSTISRRSALLPRCTASL